jgi:hypothetical protein
MMGERDTHGIKSGAIASLNAPSSSNGSAHHGLVVFAFVKRGLIIKGIGAHGMWLCSGVGLLGAITDAADGSKFHKY